MAGITASFPTWTTVIYHSAWLPTHLEGPYDPTATVGIDSVLAALDRHNVPPDDNVWVDLATVWRQLLTQPDQAAHALGKLLRRVGQHRVLWGTDAIWYGSPQPQIMAMRAFQITPEFQDRYGYPATLTDEVKAGVFGLQRGDALRPRPHGDALWPDHRSPDDQHRRVRRPSQRGRAPVGVDASWTDHAATGARLVGLTGDEVGAAVARARPATPVHTLRNASEGERRDARRAG